MNTRWISTNLFLLFGFGFAACDAGSTYLPDAGTGDTGSCAATPALNLFASRCSNSGCHAAGGQYPELTASGLANLINQMSHAVPTEALVTPGSPATSWLYKKVAGMQGPSGGALMPLGAATPIAEASILADWIMAGAPTQCAGDGGTSTFPVSPDPNNLDQGALFSCPAAAVPGSSVARIRRIDQPEWAHAISTPFGTNSNPFTNQTGAPFSTYSLDLTVDTATLDLYFLSLPKAMVAWNKADTPGRIYPVYKNAQLACIYNTAQPSAACLDNFVDRFLTLGVFARTPTADERARFRAYLVAAIGREPGGGDITKRQATLDEAGSAAWLTTAALFRAELGVPVMGDATGRRRLTNDELALALGSVLSTHRPGSPLPSTLRGAMPFVPPAPDDAMPAKGWLQQVRAAADSGQIQDPAVMRTLITSNAGGIDALRHDTLYDLSDDKRNVFARGEYWLAPRLTGFFREWLAYGTANSSFKDTPGATSRFVPLGMSDPATNSYLNLQNRFYGHDSTFVDQLDDTIARAVIESAAAKSSVFAALMTTRLWRLPSDLAGTNGQACSAGVPCTDPAYPRCVAALGVCGDVNTNNTTAVDRVYNLQAVPNTSAGRWVTMAAAERSGVLTHPAWLAAHGANFEDDASLVFRGRWVREQLFCQSVPGLENVMVQAMLGAHSPTASARDRVIAATASGPSTATCQGCHRLMNTLGLPFEIFNHAGYLRAADHGHPPDGTSAISDLPDPALNRSFTSALDFTQSLAGSGYAKRCFIRQAFRYFMGRDETMSDACTLTAMEAALDQGSFFDMLGTLVQSDPFLYRTVDGGGK